MRTRLVGLAGLLLMASCTIEVERLPVETDAGAGAPDVGSLDSGGAGAPDAGASDAEEALPDADRPDAASAADAAAAGPDASSAPDTGPAIPRLGDDDGEGRKLVWSDEFDAAEIDRTVWGNETGMVRNQEEQCYTTDAKNQYLEGGHLVLRGIHESACGGNYTSASLTTEKKQSFQYGKLEARILVPRPKGSWPAFWLLPWNKASYNPWWPAGGEIDVMEYVSQDPKTVYGTAHYQKSGKHGSSGGKKALASPVADDFHVFSIVWSATQLEWFVDGVKLHTFDTTLDLDGLHPFQDSFYVILNYAIGGTWPEDPDPAQYPGEMRVDWIRYWK